MTFNPNREFGSRMQKLEALREEGINPYPDKFVRTHVMAEGKKLMIGTKSIRLAGRLMLLRSFGKLAFGQLQDLSGRMQIAFRSDYTHKFEVFIKNLDIGDFIGVEGEIFQTKKGEITLLVSEIYMLSKSMRPLPEKWHGLKDTETKYRERYLDLVMSEESRKKFLTRTRIISLVRRFLETDGFVEIETPILQNKASGAVAKPFITHHDALKHDVYLRIAPETYLKRAIAGGFGKVYEFARCFRNEGIDPSHLPDFTMLEFYQAYANHEDLMKFTEKMFEKLINDLFGKSQIKVGDNNISFKLPLPRVLFHELIQQDCGIDIYKHRTEKGLRAEIQKKRIKIDNMSKVKGWPKLVDELYKKVSRPKIIQPIFLMNTPLELSPLARRNDKQAEIVDRFQLVVNGWEIVNAYSELIDPLDQRERFEDQAELQKKGDTEALAFDEEYLRCMEHGMPPVAGFGMGIDRLVALLTNQDNLRDTILFPLMKAEGKFYKEAGEKKGTTTKKPASKPTSSKSSEKSAPKKVATKKAPVNKASPKKVSKKSPAKKK